MSATGRMGRPPSCPKEVILRILALRAHGYSWRKIAELFNDEVVPTPAGRTRWYKSMVERTTKTLYGRAVETEADG